MSVVIPAWNAEQTLAETLESVAAQTYENLELLIVDDGSSDATPRIASDFVRKEPRARLLRKENGGLASARNHGIAAARGEWIAPVDADDVWHPEKIAKQLAVALGSVERPGFVYCWYQHIDEKGVILGSAPGISFEGPALGRIAYSSLYGTGSSLLIWRRAAMDAGGYDASLLELGGEGCEDLMFQLQVARRFPIACVPEYLVGCRKRADSMSSNSEQIMLNWHAVYERLEAAGAAIPAQVLRWSRSYVDISIAEGNAVAGAWRKIPRPLFAALKQDPIRWGLYIAYRVARTIVRLVRGRRAPPQPLRFSDARPDTIIPLDPDELEWLAGLLQTLDERRLSWVAKRESLEGSGARSTEFQQG